MASARPFAPPPVRDLVLPRDNLHSKPRPSLCCRCVMAVPLVLPRPARRGGADRRRALRERPVRALPARRHVVPALGPARPRHPRAASSAVALAAGWQAGHRAGRRERGGHVRAQLPRAACYWYRKDFEAPGGAATDWVLRFESVNYRATVWLNGRRLGRHTGGYLPFELRGQGRAPRGTNRLVVRVDSRRTEAAIPPLGVRDGGQVRGRLVELRGHPARGLPAPGRHVRLRERRSCGRASTARPATRAIYVRAVVANMERVPAARRARPPPSAGSRSASRPRRSPARGFRLFRGSAAISLPQPVEPGGPAPLHGRAEGRAGRPGRAAVHAADRHPQHRGATSRGGCC